MTLRYIRAATVFIQLHSFIFNNSARYRSHSFPPAQHWLRLVALSCSGIDPSEPIYYAMLWNPSCTPYSRGAIRSCSRRLRSPLPVRLRSDLLLARCYATEGTPIREGDKKSRLESLSGISNLPCGLSLPKDITRRC